MAEPIELPPETGRDLVAGSPVVFEPVHVELGRYDGPLSGIADVDGAPHYFELVFDVDADDWDHPNYAIWPIDAATLSLEIESWTIFVAWNDRYEAGTATVESHPGSPDGDVRFKELEQRLSNGRSAPETSDRRAARWQSLDRRQRYKVEGPDYQVAWFPVLSEG